jgi:uncharacterized membrane-anchored protein
MKKILLAFLPTFLIAIAFVGYLEYDKANGEEVVLKVVTLDPYDLFRGDYVNLNYDIERISTDELAIEDKSDLSGGDKICVYLSDTVPAKPTKIIKRDDLTSGAENFICGTYSYTNFNFTRKYLDLSVEEQGKLGPKIREEVKKEFGDYNYSKEEEKYRQLGFKADQYSFEFPSVNKFFVPKGKGYQIDEWSREGKLSANIIVTKSGNAYVNYLLLEGKKIDFESIDARE